MQELRRQQRVRNPVETAINLRKPGILELILELAEANDEEEVEMRAWLRSSPGAIVMEGVQTVVVTLLDEDPTCKMIIGTLKNTISALQVIKKLIIQPVGDTQKEMIARNFLREIFKDAAYKENLEKLYNEWERARRGTIQKLRDIADEMIKDRKKANIAKVTGVSVSTVGTATSIGATLFSIFVPHGRHIVTAATVAMSASAVGKAGGATYDKASIVADKLARRAEQQSDRILKLQAQTTKDFLKLLDEYKTEIKIHHETAKKFGDVVVRFKKLHEDRVKVTIEIGDSVEEVVGYVKILCKSNGVDQRGD